MTAEEIREIANEVVRRLELLGSSHRALVYRQHPFADGDLDHLLTGLSACGYALINCISEQKEESSPDLWEAGAADFPTGTALLPDSSNRKELETLIGSHDAVVAAGLSIAQLRALRELEITGPALSLVYEGLRQGKEVYVFSRDLHLSAAAPGFTAEVRQLTGALESWGIRFAENQIQGGTSLDKKLITVQDIQKLESGPLILSRQAVTTAAARERLEQRNIKVIHR